MLVVRQVELSRSISGAISTHFACTVSSVRSAGSGVMAVSQHRTADTLSETASPACSEGSSDLVEDRLLRLEVTTQRDDDPIGRLVVPVGKGFEVDVVGLGQPRRVRDDEVE